MNARIQTNHEGLQVANHCANGAALRQPCFAKSDAGDYHSQMEGTTCNIQKPTQNCDQREMRYVLRLRGLSKEKRYEMYKSMFAWHMLIIMNMFREDHTYDWLLRRINIAEQFVVSVDGGEKLTHDNVASKEEL